MLFSRRISCFYCGSRTPHFKSSGIKHFACDSCGSHNYLDNNGDITDPPARATAPSTTSSPQTHQAYSPYSQPPPPQPSFSSFTHELPSSLAHQETQVFCKTCLHNQHILAETLANYLPDEDDPRYREFEAALPRYKEQLEKRYPQICKACAPKAQAKIERADYYGVTSNVERNVRRDGGAVVEGRRETTGKKVVRGVFRVVDLVGMGAVGAQVAWHAYGILTTLGDGVVKDRCGEELDCSPEAKLGECTGDLLKLQVDSDCYATYATYMPTVLLVTIALLWYNPRLKDYYDPTYRYEAIKGRADHFRLQLLLLAIRTLAWYKLSNSPYTFTLATSQLLAAHTCTILLLLAGHWISQRTVRSVRWRYKGKITPKPTEQDVLGAYAGPANEHNTPRVSSSSPYDLFAKKEKLVPFPIDSLAPNQHSSQGTERYPQRPSANAYTNAPPSPPESEATVDDYPDSDAMDIDTPRSMRTLLLPNQPQLQAPSWGPLRTETFRLHDQAQTHNQQQQLQLQLRQQDQQRLSYQPTEPSPFRGRLPQAPMSLERRARNPPSQVFFKKAPESKQHDFLTQMRRGIEEGRNFAPRCKDRAQNNHNHFGGLSLGDDGSNAVVDDEQVSPAKNRTRGQLALRESSWRLQSDLSQAATGLEDMFTGSFKLDDEPLGPSNHERGSVGGNDAGVLGGLMGSWFQSTFGRQQGAKILGFAPVAVVAAFVFDFWGFRRGICLWLVQVLEGWGV